ncbi:MAG TPA: branched-chain amino acid transaminase [Anaerolineae bacterium]|nr:branched-chain amino acid transaminase [Anaerolineae bacterium]
MVQTFAPTLPLVSQRREKSRRVVPMGKWAFFDDEFVPLEEAKISIATHAFNYGTGCFGGIRAYWNEEEKQMFVFRVSKHFHRFLESCRLLNIALPYDSDDLIGITLELLRRDNYQQDAYIRPIAYKATEDITPRLYDLEDAFAMFTRPQGNYINLEVRAGTSSWRRIDDNSIPARGKITGAYINSSFARSEAHWNGYDEAIVLNQDGHVSEGSSENIFIVRHGKLVTPCVQDNILEGVTRATIMELARDELGLEIIERSIDRSELYIADEAFFTGTGAQVAAIIEIDHRPLGDGKIGPVTKQIQDLYFRTVRGRNPRYRHWLTPVYPR